MLSAVTVIVGLGAVLLTVRLAVANDEETSVTTGGPFIGVPFTNTYLYNVTDASYEIEVSLVTNASNVTTASTVIEALDGSGASDVTGTSQVSDASDVTDAYEEIEAAADWETGSCVTDTSDDEELRRDPRWLRAVVRARCIAQQVNISVENRDSDCGNNLFNNVLENSTVKYFQMMDDIHVIMPKLFCRTASRLVWRWEMPDSHIYPSSVFVVSVRKLGEDSWYLHDVIAEEHYTIDKLPPDTEFQIRVQLVTEDGIITGSCVSKWIPTLNVTYKSLQVRNVTVSEEFEFSESHVNMSIQWEPNKVDMMCDYKVYYWNLRDGKLYQIISEQEFSAKLSKLSFNGSYRAFVISGDEESNNWSDDKAVVNITTPPCLDVWSNDISICSPPQPLVVRITFLKLGEGHYINVSWIPAKLFPERYNVSIEGFASLSKFEEHKFVNGNKTSVTFQNARPDIVYRGCVTAISSGGISDPNCDLRKFRSQVKRRADVNKKSEISEITIIVVVSLSVVCMILLVTLLLHYHFNKKRSKKLRNCEYFKDLEKETPKEKMHEQQHENSESTVSYFDDEWEISEDRLIIEEEDVGKGAFGVVHRGILLGKTHLEPDRKVAVKMLRDDSNAEDLRQFREEIAMMKSIDSHPHIVSLIGCCTRTKQIRIIVEYCALGDLRNYLQENKDLYARNVNHSQDKSTEGIKYAELMSVETDGDADYEDHKKTSIAINQMYFANCVKTEPKKGTLLPSDLLSFARQIAMGMEFLASNYIVHRDLAARNVLVCSKKTVKISDFGLSRDIYEQNVYHKRGRGKIPIHWTAFESLKNHKYTTQSDVWSFGILLWEISTLGEMPYPGIPRENIFQYLKKGKRMECPPNCSLDLYEIMSSCWRESPSDRPTFTKLRNKLDSLLETTSPQQYLSLNINDVECPEIPSTADPPLSDDHKNAGVYCGSVLIPTGFFNQKQYSDTKLPSL